MQYMLLIYTDESKIPAHGTAEFDEMMGGFFSFTEEVQNAGIHVGGDELAPVSTATTVQVRDGEMLLTDGPFAETREQLGGYYILECEDLDQALAWARKIPTAAFGSVEVRPLVDHSAA